VKAGFDHLSIFDDMNAVRPQNGSQTVRDHQRRAILVRFSEACAISPPSTCSTLRLPPAFSRLSQLR
jgi:hypothetical protein